MQPLMEAMTLSIYYDAEANRVTRAEFSQVGSPTGRIILEIGRVELDAEKLTPDYWTSSATEVHEAKTTPISPPGGSACMTRTKSLFSSR